MSRRWAAVIVMVGLAWGGVAAIFSLGWLPRLGLDLQGGTSVILEAPEGTDEQVVENGCRSDAPAGSRTSVASRNPRSQSAAAPHSRPTPGVTDQERALDAVGRTGLLSFRPVLSCTAIASFTCIPSDRSPVLLEAEQVGEDFIFPDGVDPETGLTGRTTRTLLDPSSPSTTTPATWWPSTKWVRLTFPPIGMASASVASSTARSSRPSARR